jgi:5'-3' exonuclease
MPIRSFKLLPECYRKIATNELQDFFPDDFSVDLNGKALAWEAIVLIPFVDQAIFLEMEAKMLSSGQGSLSKKEHDRNKWTFCYHNYTYSAQNQSAGPLLSTLTGLKPIPHDYSRCEINNEYQHVGE